MRKLAIAAATAVLAVTGAHAADDPIAIRKAVMQSVGASAGVAGAMMKGQLDYNPAVGKSVIAAMNAAAVSYGSFFPEGSVSADSTASPKIWEDAAGFAAALAKFSGTTQAAMSASGKDGPADLDAFKAAMGPVFGNCKACHEGYRVKK